MVLHSISFSSKILSLSKTLPFSFQCHSLLYADGSCYSGRKKVSWHTPIGTAKVLLFPTLIYMPNKLVTLWNTYLRTLLTPMEKISTIGSLLMQLMKQKQWDGMKKATTDLAWWSCFLFHPLESEFGMVFSPPQLSGPHSQGYGFG